MKYLAPNIKVDTHGVSFLLSNTGILYSDPYVNPSTNNIEIDFNKYPVIQSSTFHPCVLKPPNGWVQSSEPDEHLDHIARSFLALDHCFDSLCAFSYKDVPLYERICQYKPDLQLNILFGPDSLRLYPEDLLSSQIMMQLQSSMKGNHCFSALSEHYDHPNIILKSLFTKASKCSSSIYFEVPDCSWFFANGSPLFAWEQHKSFYPKHSCLCLPIVL